MPEIIDILTLRVPAMLLAITFHEFAHARIALAFGDTTAQDQGRVTLNPIAHLDPIGTIGMMVGPFGWGKPVPVSPGRMSHPRADFFVSAGGPLTNLAIASLAGLLLHVLPISTLGMTAAAVWLFRFLYMVVVLNVGLGLFNLVPLFPLDGSHMLENLLPIEKAYAFKRFGDAYGMPILFALLVMPMLANGFSPLGLILGPPFQFVVRLLTPA